MACFFRRKITQKLAQTLQQNEDALTTALTTVPVFKKEQTADFKLSVHTLRLNGSLPRHKDGQQQTEDLARALQRDSVMEEISTGRGVIYFRLNRILLIEKMMERLRQDADTFGLNSELLKNLKRGTTLVEFSSPNIAKKLHAGHMRSTIIGNFIANLKQSLGNTVIRMNHLGDWGMQLALLGVGFARFGCQEKLRNDPLQHLFDVYVQINKEAEDDSDVHQAARDFFRQLVHHDRHAVSLWQQFRDITVEEYQKVYERLGVRFDVYSGESQHQAQVGELIVELRKQGLLKTTEEGTSVVDVSGAGNASGQCTLLRSDGTSLYITRDIAAAIDRMQRYRFDEMIYVTDKSQESHFSQMFEILSMMGHTWADKCRHVSFGLVEGMKTRTGEVVFLEDVLDEARERMLNNMRQSTTTKEMADPGETAEKIALSALILQDFRAPLSSNYEFNWDRMLQSVGETGVFLQYTHARLCSLIRGYDGALESGLDPSLLLEPSSVAVLQHLLRYDEVLHQSALDLQPKHLVNFLMKLCHLVASALKQLPVKGSPPRVAQARLQLFGGARSVLCNGMKILGMEAVDRM